MSALLRSGRTVLLSTALLLVGGTASADVTWNWKFGSEARERSSPTARSTTPPGHSISRSRPLR